MSITTYLDDFDADLEMKRVLGTALEMTRVSLGLVDKFADGIIARRIIELGKAGERNPDILCEEVLKDIRRPQQWAASEAARSSVLTDPK